MFANAATRRTSLKKVVFASVWVGLFLGTVGIRSLVSRADTDDTDNESVRTLDPFATQLSLLQRQFRQLELEQKPRRSSTPLTNLDDLDTAFPDLIATFPTTVVRSKKEFVGCAKSAMAKTDRPSEYFDVSFALRPDGENIFRLTELVMERSTLEFTADEQQCVLSVLESLRLEAPSAPQGRVVYNFCFTR